MPYQWLIGKKVYDPEKIRVFLEAIWSRISKEEDDHFTGAVAAYEIEHLCKLAQTVTSQLRDLKKISTSNGDAIAEADELFINLKKITAQFLTLYFRMRVMESQNSRLRT
jgi:hypothetical protein